VGILAVFGSMLLKTVLPSLATAISGYVVAILHKKLAKAHIELSTEVEAQLAAVVENAVLAINERAHRQAKSDTAAPQFTTMSGQEKRRQAMELVLQSLPNADSVVVGAVIDATLQRLRQ